MKFHRGSVASIIVLLVSIPSVGQADPVTVLDQAFVPSSVNLQANLYFGIEHAQTFTVGVDGFLASVDVLLTRVGEDAPLRFDLRRAPNGVPQLSDSDVLAAGDVRPSSVGTQFGFVNIDLRSFALRVTPGDLLAIVMSSPSRNDGERYIWGGGEDGGLPHPNYPGGAFYSRTDPSLAWVPDDLVGSDIGFRTFVRTDAAPVPEPATLLLVATAAAIGTFNRRKLRTGAKATAASREK